MTAIPHTADPTLVAVDAAIEVRGNAKPPRPYLGMSEIGRACARALWYGFRWCSPSRFDAATLKRFEDGHRGEDVQANRLRQVEGITLLTVDPRTDQQFGFSDHGGHFRGHMDGAIHGLLQAPQTWHVWEHKQTDEKKQQALTKAKQTCGEKAALADWNAIYYGQGVLYMHYSGMDRHYLTCASAGGRHTISVRTNADPVVAHALIDKAKRVITSESPLARLSERPDWYECQWCDHHGICHGKALPVITCRTCAHATPELDGDGRWSCAWYGCDLSVDTQRQGAQCPQHILIPHLAPWEPIDASPSEGWIEYRKADGTVVRNGPDGDSSLALIAMGAA